MIWISLAWYFLFFLGPIAMVFVLSFLSRGTYGGLEWHFQLGAYDSVLRHAPMVILAHSIQLASSTTLLCAVIAIPLCWKIATLTARTRRWVLFLVVLPFFMNSVVRVYSLKLLISSLGPAGQAVPESFWVGIGMIMSYLPLMIFPLYAAFEKFDFGLVEAAQDLGAGSVHILFTVILPCLRKALVNACLLVFIPCLGEFLIPDLVGGAKNMLFANLISEEFLKARNWPFGAALSVVMLLVLFLIVQVVRQIEKDDPPTRQSPEARA